MNDKSCRRLYSVVYNEKNRRVSYENCIKKGRDSRASLAGSPPDLAGLHPLNRVQPYPAAGVTRHAQVAPWGDGNRADLRSVREAGTLELLAEETAVEYLKPFKDYSIIIDIFKRNFCDSVYLIGSKSKT